MSYISIQKNNFDEDKWFTVLGTYHPMLINKVFNENEGNQKDIKCSWMQHDFTSQIIILK